MALLKLLAHLVASWLGVSFTTALMLLAIAHALWESVPL